jgi:DNA modification methylase
MKFANGVSKMENKNPSCALPKNYSLSFFSKEETRDKHEYLSESESDCISKFGTFRDSKSAPIHRWFQYPAGFSYKAVEAVLKYYGISRAQKVYDPFSGSGTTNVVCKNKGIESFGVEAHPFVVKIAQTKVKWDYDYSDLNDEVLKFVNEISGPNNQYYNIDLEILPKLVHDCYSKTNLQKLISIRDLIEKTVKREYRDLFDIALISTLRQASGAATGWPYIAPKKKIVESDGIVTFIKQLNMCLDDLKKTPLGSRSIKSEIIEGDCRKTNLPEEYFDFVFTSPPYLNNFDYADRTRLEAYFMGYAGSWGEISDKIRTKLIMSATTQVARLKFNVEDIISQNLKDINNRMAEEIQLKVSQLEKVRNQKGGKKSYDIMVGQYFNDITDSLVDTYRIMKQGTKYLLILGDSAPYGVHIPTETYIGEIGLGVGFKHYHIKELRTRGDKWKGNPQRHHIPLRESILILEK